MTTGAAPLRRGAADLLFVNGSVRTMEPAPRGATALAARGGRITAVGLDADLRGLAGRSTRVVDLAGRTLLPGFQDAHVHPPLGGWAMLTCDLHDVPWVRDAYVARIAAYAAERPAEPWIIGGGWSMPAFARGTPSRRDLDAAVSDRPAFLENRDGHGAWVNSRALELAGITATTPDPVHGRIEREADGSPQGTLHEGERLDLDSALAAFTTGAAWANGLGGETGTLEPGKLADLVILDRDVSDRSAGEIGDARVLLTLSEGVAVHADPELDW